MKNILSPQARKRSILQRFGIGLFMIHNDSQTAVRTSFCALEPSSVLMKLIRRLEWKLIRRQLKFLLDRRKGSVFF